ncbi:FGGY-family carbohydrate kinase [Faecalicatena acetigenes]|uniref:FGGY-family carbohydrate kinase n=1 Tax=Faecalicatena acetigenes TaxID=2981790 RepID=A0ABT2TCM3_9FIRM|nr:MULTISPECIES: FGGY-family carbohydrate kinase [Lachnospiraceae]MCU6747995.1 FGGY-family carbohydrate kinase [Faecalicatena acetigenes]SCI21252.1 Xylulose kinase [uncultured Clostridium sp.]
MQLLLGLDAGTTALKVALFDAKGQLLGVSTQEYALETPQINYVEVDAEVYWQAFKSGLAEIRQNYEIRPEDEIALAISAQGETLICIDKTGRALRKAIVWMDNRAVDEAKAMEQHFGNAVCYKVTGQVSFEPCWPAPKILWIKNHEPEVFEHTDRFLLLEDYLIYRMTGSFNTEGSLVCSSVYWDILNKCYWKEMLEFIGISEYQLAEVVESATVVDEILDEVREELGFPCKVTVSTGALDQVAGAIGAGNIREGMFSETIGAALAICAPVSRPVFDPNQKMPLHYFALPDTYMIHTFTTGGMTLRWFRDKFCADEMAVENSGGGDAYDLISKEVEKIAPGCDGLVMLPHLSGSLAPDVNAKAKGVWFGFSLNHTKPHFARAIMESLAFILRRNLEALKDMGISVKEVRSLGGGSKSRVWNQIKADANDITLVTVQSKEAACLGAAILAGTATGVFESVEDAVENMIKVKDQYQAQSELKAIYDKNYEMYCKLFQDLTECFDRTV